VTSVQAEPIGYVGAVDERLETSLGSVLCTREEWQDSIPNIFCHKTGYLSTLHLCLVGVRVNMGVNVEMWDATLFAKKHE